MLPSDVSSPQHTTIGGASPPSSSGHTDGSRWARDRADLMTMLLRTSPEDTEEMPDSKPVSAAREAVAATL